MKVILLKNHLDNKEGDFIEVTDKRAEYLIRTGVAKKILARKVKKQK